MYISCELNAVNDLTVSVVFQEEGELVDINAFLEACSLEESKYLLEHFLTLVITKVCILHTTFHITPMLDCMHFSTVKPAEVEHLLTEKNVLVFSKDKTFSAIFRTCLTLRLLIPQIIYFHVSQGLLTSTKVCELPEIEGITSIFPCISGPARVHKGP